MSKSKQLDFGNESEKIVALFYKRKGYWAYILPKKVNGQPVDIIAMKENINWFVDAKHLIAEKKSFPFSRIEPNQKDSMQYAKNFAKIKNIGFVIVVGLEQLERIDLKAIENGLINAFFLPYDKLIELEEKGFKSVKIEELESFQEVLDECEL